MLKNKKFVKIVVSMLLSVTLVCAMCLQVFADSATNDVSYMDTANNLLYTSKITGSVNYNENTVYAVQASTSIAPIDSSTATTYTLFVVETQIQMYRGGNEIYNILQPGVVFLGIEGMDGEVATEWIVPDVNQPFDYVITTHKVYSVESITNNPNGYQEVMVGDLLWEDLRVFSYSDFLYF